MKYLLLLLVAGLFAGCSTVPANLITLRTPLGRYTIQAPKNVGIEKFEASVETNGTLKIKFDKWDSTNDANVIDKASAGRAAEIRAWSDGAGAIVGQALQGIVKGAKPLP